MTDYRDPNDPSRLDPVRADYRDRGDANRWSTATWGWIAGLSLVVLILIFAFGMGSNGDRTASTQPPATTGQSQPAIPPAGSKQPVSKQQAPSANPAPEPETPKQ